MRVTLALTLVMKITIAIVILIAVGLGMISYLGYAKFVKVYRQVEESRFGVVLVELKSEIELDMTLGLPLAELPDIGKVLAREKRLAAGIDDLKVTAPDGTILFSAAVSGPAAAARVPAGWLTGPGADPGQPFRSFSDGTLFGLSAPVGDSFGRQVGAVVLTYRRAASDAVVSAVFDRLVRLFGLVFVGFAGIAAVAVWVCFRPVGRSFARMTGLLGGTAAGAEATEAAGAVRANDLEHQVVAFRSIAEAARTEISRVAGGLPAPEAWSVPAMLGDAGLKARLAGHGVATDLLYADPGFVALIEQGLRRFAEGEVTAGPARWPAPETALGRALGDPAVRGDLLAHGLDADDLLGDPAFGTLAAWVPPRRAA